MNAMREGGSEKKKKKRGEVKKIKLAFKLKVQDRVFFFFLFATPIIFPLCFNINNCHYNIITIKLLLQKTLTIIIIIINNNDQNSYMNVRHKNAFKKRKEERQKERRRNE